MSIAIVVVGSRRVSLNTVAKLFQPGRFTSKRESSEYYYEENRARSVTWQVFFFLPFSFLFYVTEHGSVHATNVESKPRLAN